MSVTFALGRELTSSLARGCFVILIRGIFSASALFSATKPDGDSLLKKMRPNAINGAITLRRWNMTIPILRVELATAKERRSSKYPLL
jgi:hypothetical protein